VSTRPYQTGASLPGQESPAPGAVSANPGTRSLWALRKPDGSIEAGWYLVPLRLFLGVTFVFAALQKLANPNFFRSTSPISIHAQLLAATHTSPIHALVSPLASLSTAVGLAIALGELAVGVGTLLGLITRGAAVGGLLLNLMLFLTVSFHAAPFYTGSDIVFVFAWTPLILAGAAGAPALDTWLARQRELVAVRSPESNAVTAPGVSRRSVVSVGAMTAAVAGVAAVLGGAAAGLGRAIGGTPASTGGTHLLSSGPTSTTKSTATTPSSGSGTPEGTAVGSAASVPVGGSAAFTDPHSGDPSIVIQQTEGDFVAFDAICPHAGCTVAYQAASKIIACPCHGSEFNPKSGDVIRGPATYGLTPIGITEGPNGDLYVRT
jgi:thiosulfate dehydrogenase (quinone) large subunit